MQAFSQWFSGFPGLIWRIERQRSRLEVFNQWQHRLLGEQTTRLLKDSQFRKQVVSRKDLPLLAEYYDLMAGGEPAAVCFRLEQDAKSPLLLQGWTSQEDPQWYCGILKYAHQSTPFSVEGGFDSCQMALSRSGYPVLVIDAQNKKFLACNSSARQCFCPTDNSLTLPVFATIAPGELGEHVVHVAKQSIAEDVWSGTLVLRNGAGQVLTAKARVSPCHVDDSKAIVRIALLSHRIATQTACESIDTACAAHAYTLDNSVLKSALQQFYNASVLPVDGLMFSDIRSLEGRVHVYGVGTCFEGKEWGAAHSYEGTIAQDIERFGLQELVVEDTLDSIKSIDWVMFIPHGVRSYLALPFFDAHGLYAVLVLASKTPGFFTSVSRVAFQHIEKPFAQLAHTWHQHFSAMRSRK